MDKHKRDFLPSHQAADHGEAAAFAHAQMGEQLRDLIVAGGLRGFTVDEMFPEVTR